MVYNARTLYMHNILYLGPFLSSIVDKTASEDELHSTRGNTPLNEMSDKQRLNGTDPKQLHSVENGEEKIKASTDYLGATGDSEQVSTFT